MRSLARWTLALALCATASLAPPLRAEGDPTKEFAALDLEFETTELKWRDAYAAFEPRFEKFATSFPGTEEALTAKIRVLTCLERFEDDAAQQKRADVLADSILAEYPNSPQLAELVGGPRACSPAKSKQFDDALADPLRPPVVRGAYLLLHGAWGLRGKTAAEQKKGREDLELVLKKYADIPFEYSTLGEKADAYLNPVAEEDLAVGKIAPNFSGRSVDGKTIKLSDFKGKVVVVNFFGDW